MLQNYANSNPVRFHMPGHKGSLEPLDVTETSATDNLNDPDNFIIDAQSALSKSYGSAHSFFMVNGSTGGVHAMLRYASLTDSSPILISRNCHKSVITGCLLYKLDTIVIEEKFDNEMQTFIFDEQHIINCINQNPTISAVLITSADYFGRTVDISKLSKLCKEKKILLLCDEAHGAHYIISTVLPDSALPYVDICVQSPHKTLSALTQSAYMHARDSVDIDKLKSVIFSLQTTSPNSMLVQSMDNARYEVDTMAKQWEKRAKEVNALSKKINKISNLSVIDEDFAKASGYSKRDITRLVIDVSQIGSGIEIGKILEDRYNIFMEMYTFKYIVGILTPWDKASWDKKLYVALDEISKAKCSVYDIPEYPENHIKAMSMLEAESAHWIKIPIKDAANAVATAPIGVYPPGVALVLPGEVISQEIIDYMYQIHKIGGNIFGVTNGYVNCVKGSKKLPKTISI